MSDPVPHEAVFDELQRIEASKAFQGSARLLALLRFLVEETLQGHGAQLKEAVIGNAIYGRDPAYDPRIDSTVRVEARRLRRKLTLYFAGEGREDPVEIAVPTGRYAATFAARMTPSTPAAPVTANLPAVTPLFEAGPGATAAVLPFLALSRDPADQELADRLTDEITFTLSQAEGLRMATRAAVRRYAESARPGEPPAASLGVDAVLQGSLRRHGGILRVIAELSDTQGYVVWSDRFDTPDADPLQVLERIAATLASRLGLDHSLVRAGALRPRPGALQAMAAISHARRLLDSQRPAALRAAMALFERVARVAPDTARGHSGIADCACDLYRLGLLDRTAAAHIARTAVRRALEIDPASAEAHATLATIAAWIDFDLAGSDAWFARVQQLGETARASRIRGVALLLLRDPDGAARQLRAARVLEPISVHQDIAEAISLYHRRQFAALAGRFGRAPPVRAAAEARYYGALALLETGAAEAAREVVADIADELIELPDLALGAAEIAARLGDPAPAVVTSATAQECAASPFARATLAMALHRPAEALEALAACVARQDLSRAWLRTDMRFDPLRGMPAFDALVDEVRQAAGRPGA